MGLHADSRFRFVEGRVVESVINKMKASTGPAQTWQILAVVLFLLFLVPGLYAMELFGREAEIPDTSALRHSQAGLLELPLNELSRQARSRFLDGGEAGRIRFEIDTSKKAYTEFRFLVAAPGGKSWSMDEPGSVMIRRIPVSNAFTFMRICLRKSPAIYMDLEADGNKTLLGIRMPKSGFQLYHELRVSLSIDRLMGISFQDLRKITESRLDWGLLTGTPDSAYYDRVITMADRISKALPGLPDSDDGAMDENGKLVHIADLKLNALPGLNCSGFAKWIADGVYHDLTGHYLSIESLRQKNLENRGNTFAENYEDARDPYFGLDWIRNIASLIKEAELDRQSEDRESQDVRNVDFLSYTEDKGYESGSLDLLLYVLAQKTPGYFYLASVNGTWGTKPVLWQHYHIVSFFPYFDAGGVFRVRVFERNIESSLESLHRRYPGEFFHLVRIKAPKDFIPPVIM